VGVALEVVLVRNALWFSAWSVSFLCGCAEVIIEDPPSQLNGVVPANGAPNQPALPGAQLPGMSPVVAAPPPTTSPGGGNAGAGPAAAVPSTNPPPSVPSNTPPRPTGPSGEVLFFDDFEDGDDMNWVPDMADGNDVLGAWAVVEAEGGRYYAQTDASFDDDSWAVSGDVEWTDVALVTRFRFTEVREMEDAIVMLAVRFQSKDDYYYLQYSGDGTVKIRKRVGGSEPELASQEATAAAVGQWIDLGLTARGTSLEASVGGMVVSSDVVDADLANGGIALGVRENAAVEFDDVTVTVP